MIVVALAVFSQWRYVYRPWNLCAWSACASGRETKANCSLCSGNGLVSYYIHLILAKVGVKDPNTQGAINGGLQVSKPPMYFKDVTEYNHS